MASHKILVIDDSKVIRSRVRDMLPKGNFEVLEAKDGLEGLNLVKQERPNLIMLDFLLPRMSGWEVFQQIQSQPDLQVIPLVVMSGRKEEVTEKLPEPFEFFEFIEKPFEQKELIDAIKSAMQKSRLPRPFSGPTSAAPTTGAPVAASGGADVQALTDKVNTLQAEVESLKKQMTASHTEVESLKKQLSQIVTFIKQKLK